MGTDRLETVREVFDALGGSRAVARLTGKSWSSVCNWLPRNKFPPDTYVAIQGALVKLGKSAPASLWGMAQPSEAA